MSFVYLPNSSLFFFIQNIVIKGKKPEDNVHVGLHYSVWLSKMNEIERWRELKSSSPNHFLWTKAGFLFFYFTHLADGYKCRLQLSIVCASRRLSIFRVEPGSFHQHSFQFAKGFELQHFTEVAKWLHLGPVAWKIRGENKK